VRPSSRDVKRSPEEILMPDSTRSALATFALLFAFLSATLSAQNIVLTQDPVTTVDLFGRSVDIEGSFAVVGAPRYDPGGRTDAGAAFIYRNDGGTWIQEAMLTGPGLAADAGDSFGQSVAISGGRVVVGAYEADPGGLWAAGAAYVFTRDPDTGTWSRVRLIPTDLQIAVNLGYSVDIDGDTILVGAYNYDEGGFVNDNDDAISNSGTVYVFQFDGTNWVQQARLTAPASDRVDSQRFGAAVALDGDVALIGAMTATETGKAYVFTRTGTSWSQTATLTPSSNAPNSAYAQSLALDLPHALVSAYRLDGTGAAFIFRLDAGTWSETAALPVPADVENVSWFGFSTAIRGDLAIVGAPMDDLPGLVNAGTVRVYQLSGSAWTHQQVLTAATPEARSEFATGFGSAVAFDGARAIVGDYTRPPSFQGAAEIISMVEQADVSITKTLTTAGPFIPGQSVEYTLLVSNAGPGAATITVTDTPTNLLITSVSGGGCAALPCTLPSLASGNSVTIDVSATITAPGAFDNSATATAAEPDPDTTNNTDATGNGGIAIAFADLSLTKTLVTAGPYYAGQAVTYELLIANAGPSAATALLVNDTPVNLSVTGVSGAGCAALPCTIPALAASANTTITVLATIIAEGAFSNSASVDGVEDDPDLANNAAAINAAAVAAADLSIVKTLNTPAPYNAGETVSYTLTITNQGPSSATGIDVTDTPTGMTITSVSGSGCAAFPCIIPSLPSGASTQIDILATLDPESAFDNSASVAGNELDLDASNNTDATGNGGTIGTAADLSIVKTLVTAGPFTEGQTVSYTIAVANDGPSTATSVLVSDTPTNLTITGVSGAGCVAFPCTLPALGAGSGATIDVTATISTAGAFDNGAAVTATESDPDLSDNADPAGNGGTAAASADVSIVKTLITAGPFTAGQSVAYTLVVSNAGPSAATGIQITDSPANLAIESVSGACAALPCTLASLGSGANATIEVTATIGAAGAFDNTASVTANEPDPILANNSDASGNGGTAAAAADLSIVKTLTTSGPFETGQTIAYTIVVANAGPSPATGIIITDTPSNLTIATVSGSSCAAFPCTVPLLASGSSLTLDVTAVIDSAGAFDNSAAVTGVEADPDPSNNVDPSGNGGAVGMADVSITSTLMTPTPFYEGQVVTYSIVVSNSGPASATSIAITDTWTNLTIGTVSGACTALPCAIPALAAGTSVTIEITATIDAEGAFDQGAAVLAAETDPDLSNNSDMSGNGGTAVAAEAIPFTSTTVLLLLALVLAIAGSAVIGKA
jgi:uncharacterized repeat protein (TIGR01451 family)